MSAPLAATTDLVSSLLLRPKGPVLDIERIAMAPVDLLISQSMIQQIPSLITSPSVSESDGEMLSNYKIKIWGIKINGESTLEGHCLVGEEVDISIYWDIVNLSSGCTPGTNWSDAQKALVDSIKTVSETFFQLLFAGSNMLAMCKLSHLAHITNQSENPETTRFVSQMTTKLSSPGIYKFHPTQICSRVSQVVAMYFASDVIATSLPLEEETDIEGETAIAVPAPIPPESMPCEDDFLYGIRLSTYKMEGSIPSNTSSCFTITAAAADVDQSPAEMSAGGGSGIIGE